MFQCSIGSNIKVEYHPSFSRHGIARACSALLIWVNEARIILSARLGKHHTRRWWARGGTSCCWRSGVRPDGVHACSASCCCIGFRCAGARQMGWGLSQGKGGMRLPKIKIFGANLVSGFWGKQRAGRRFLGVWDDGWGAVTGALGMYRVAIA